MNTVGDLLLFIVVWIAAFVILRQRDRSRLVSILASLGLALIVWYLVLFAFGFSQGFLG